MLKATVRITLMPIMVLVAVLFVAIFGIFASDLLALEDEGDPEQTFAERPEWAGLWINTFGRDENITEYISPAYLAGEADRLRWKDIETNQGEYDWSALYNCLKRARDNGYYYYFELWTGYHGPEWIYENGVPKVKMKTGGFAYKPYYLDTEYKHYLKSFLKEFANYIASLPADLRDRLAFIQPGFGSTGDRQLYKGEPVDSQYDIDSAGYIDFMKEMTISLTNEFNRYKETKDIPFLWNVDDYDGSDPSQLDDVSDRLRGEMLYAEWMHENFNTNLRKQQFTIAIGYMAIGEKSQDDEQRANFFGYNNGQPQYVRGEFNDTRWANTPMAKLNQEWNYYWTAISSVDRGLDGWEIKMEGLEGGHLEAFKFSSRYSGFKEAETSPFAFIALRDVLDYSDKKRFPESIYGPANKTNEDRVNAILDKYSDYGARNDDTNAVLTLWRNAYLHDSEGLNDCVWDVIDRNYRRFITQYQPNQTSVGLWRVGPEDEPYGRFARSFEHSSGRNAMYFNLDDDFFGGSPLNGDYPVEIKVIYYDEGYGSWELRYDAVDDSDKKAYSVTNTDANTWKEKVVTLDDAYFGNRSPNDTDFYLYNADEEDNIFHMIEIEKKP